MTRTDLMKLLNGLPEADLEQVIVALEAEQHVAGATSHRQKVAELVKNQAIDAIVAALRELELLPTPEQEAPPPDEPPPVDRRERMRWTAEQVTEAVGNIDAESNRQAAAQALVGDPWENKQSFRRKFQVKNDGRLNDVDFDQMVAALDVLHRECRERGQRADANLVAQILDLILWLGFPPEMLDEVARLLEDRSAALVHSCVTYSAGAEVTAAWYDGEKPDFGGPRADGFSGTPMLHYARPPLGDPTVEAKVIEILKDLSRQVGVVLNSALDAEPDKQKAIAGWAEELRRVFAYHRTTEGRLHYCVFEEVARDAERERLEILLGAVRQRVPDLAFFELAPRAPGKPTEEIVIQMLKNRFPDQE